LKVKVREFFNVRLGDRIYSAGEEIEVTPAELELVAHQVEAVSNRREKRDANEVQG